MIFLLLFNILCFAVFISCRIFSDLQTGVLKAMVAFVVAICLTILLHIAFLFAGIEFVFFIVVLNILSALVLISFRNQIKTLFGLTRKRIAPLMAGCLALIVFVFIQASIPQEYAKLRFTLTSNVSCRFQLFYTTKADDGFSEARSKFAFVKGDESSEQIEFVIPANIGVDRIRLDIGERNVPGEITFNKLDIIGKNDSVSFNGNGLNGKFAVNQFVTDLGNGHLRFKNDEGFDPYIILEKDFFRELRSIASANRLLRISRWASLLIVVLVVVLGVWMTTGKIELSAIFLAAALLISTFSFIKVSFRWGEWDAWAIWTLHAKFLMSSHWSSLFSGNIIWTHPDYPLLLPDLLAVLARCLNGLTPVLPMIVAVCIYSLIIVIVFYAVRPNKFLPYAGVVLLLLSPAFITLSAMQYADTLVALMYLIAIVFISKINEEPKAMIASGLVASLCVWTKDEGSIFLMVFSVFIVLRYIRSPKRSVFYVLGTILPVLLLIIFKLAIAPKVGLTQSIHGELWVKLKTMSRYFTIADSFTTLMMRDHKIFVGCLLLTGISMSLRRSTYLRLTIAGAVIIGVATAFVTSAPAFILPGLVFLIFLLSFEDLLRGYSSYIFIPMGTLLCYLAIYVVTPMDIVWHLDNSLNRLVHQVYPVVLFIGLWEVGKKRRGLLHENNFLLF